MIYYMYIHWEEGGTHDVGEVIHVEPTHDLRASQIYVYM